jgi:alpha-L-rhamnosidase
MKFLTGLLMGLWILPNIPAAMGAPGSLQPTYLRAEYRVNPLGIDAQLPRLCWIVRSEERAQRQTAYQILVASSRERLRSDQADLWDSGKVQTSDTTAIVYAGLPLASRSECYWKVRVWDALDRNSPWSKTALWSMGLLAKSDWQARWIGYDKPVDQAKDATVARLSLPPARYLRRTFHTDKPIRRATLYSSALGIYQMHLNGKRVGSDYFAPGWTDYQKRVYYQTYDVTEQVKPGENAIGAILADGWYAGYLGFGGLRDHYGNRIRLLAQLELEHIDGTRTVITTGPEWKGSTGPLTEADFLMGEQFDARLEIDNWDQCGWDDSVWSAVDVSPNPSIQLQASPGVPIGELDPLRPVKITQPAPGRQVIDLGQNFAGVVRLKVRGDRGQRIRIRHAERLQPDGNIYTQNLRSALATDVYTCRGDEHDRWWQPRFTFHGFQYVEITGYPDRLTSADLVGIPLSSLTPVAGQFECSNPMVNQLFSNIYWTQRMNHIDVPTDCPQRDERLGWTGDAQVYVHTASMLTDIQAFYTKWLIDLDDAQRDDGQYPMVAPLKSKGVSADGGPAWADAGVICPWNIYQTYGDRQLLQQHYSNMARFIEFCKNRSTPELLPPAQFHCFGDWLSIEDDTPKEVIYVAYFAHSTQLMQRAAEALGKRGDAEEYGKLFQRIKKAFQQAYIDREGRILGDTQSGYVLALAFDLVEGEQQQAAASRLVELIQGRDWHLSTGFIGTKDLMLVLNKIGRTDVAYRLLLNKTFPSWGFSIANGATSIWERWNGWTPENGFFDPSMNSFAHYSFGAVAGWMFETIGGISTREPGYQRILIQPQPGGDLTWAKVSYRSIRGPITTQWKITGGKFILHVAIPANTTAELHMPAATAAQVTEGGHAADDATGVRYLRKGNGVCIYELGSGDYTFAAPFSKTSFP